MRTLKRSIDGRLAGGFDALTVLVVGGADLAAKTALELCVECDVTLCSPRASLRHITREFRFVLNELHFENEIKLRFRTAIDRITQTGGGRLRVFFTGGETRPAVFDEVLDCSERAPLGTFGHPGQQGRRTSARPDEELRRAG